MVTTLAERGELSRAARSFLRTESGSAVLLLAAAALALRLGEHDPAGYEEFWHTELSVSFGGTELALDLRHWVNDGLMVLFFFIGRAWRSPAR